MYPPPAPPPLFGAVQVEDFQLVPVLTALRMPRVSLLLADDVGLGKTIEAGLILTELLIRRRVRRVLILSPASLCHQWQQELRDKFALSFDVVDRAETHALQKRLGLDANPWRTFPRIIASYHYLKQSDVLEQFRAACRQPEGSAVLPWDLLIVDEAHNLMPSNFGEDSDLCKMLRLISPWFEHKIFLTATPHNGYTRCFSGLLELLDPVRFTRTDEFTKEEIERAAQVVIRRLKREVNALERSQGRPERFAERFLKSVPLCFGRLDRHGQARDVTVFHFVSDDEADLKFLAHVVRKVHAIREDLGAMGEVFDAAFELRFGDLQDTERVTRTLDMAVENRKGRVEIPRATNL